MEDELLKFTNGQWQIARTGIEERLQLERVMLMNDFGAVAHAVARLHSSCFLHLCGPQGELPGQGTISILGPGTGLGVAQLHREGEEYHVVETEGSHIGFAPTDEVEDQILLHFRQKFGRASVERLISGRGFADLYAALGRIEGREVESGDERQIWSDALDGRDDLAVKALDRFCRIFGSVAGDFALAHGATAVAIAGGLGQRLSGHLPSSGFAERFVEKGRYRGRMERIEVKLVTHPQPGLYGAAAAFAKEAGSGAG